MDILLADQLFASLSAAGFGAVPGVLLLNRARKPTSFPKVSMQNLKGFGSERVKRIRDKSISIQ
jgi:hypothetical protein